MGSGDADSYTAEKHGPAGRAKYRDHAAAGPPLRLTAQETSIQIHGVGPWVITYVNPADDPAKKTKLILRWRWEG